MPSNAFKEECKANVQNLKYGTVNIKNTTTNITESDDLQEFDINSSCYVNDKFIGTTVAKKIKIKILDDGGYDLENKDVSVKTGIEIEDEIEYQELGTYTIPKPDTDEVSGKTEVTGYDYMSKFDIPYVDNNTYPIRADDYLENLCEQVGVVLGSKNFPNNDYMIKGNPFTNGETCKTVLSNVVQLTAGFADIDIDEKLYIRNFDISGNPVETIDGNNYDEFKPNKVFGPVNSVRIQMNSGVDGEETVKEEEGITDATRCQITISDNYFLISAEERNLVIDDIYNALHGLTYLPVEINYYGYPWLKLGSKIKVKDKSDTEYITYVMEHSFKWNGSYSGTIKSFALTKTQSAYKEIMTMQKWKRNTELAVNKINGEITSIVEEQTEQSTQITQIEQTVDEISQKVENITDLTQTVTGTQTIALAECAEGELLSLNIKGNNTVFKTLFPMSNLYPANNLYPGGDSLITVTDKDKDTVEYNLGVTEVLRQNGDIYDEYILANGQAKVIRRINADGTVKGTEEIENLGTLNILLKEGTNTIKIKNYTAEISAKYAVKSDYTDVFATKVEMNSAISQTAEAISTEVNKKVDDEELGTKITQNYESVQIAWNKISEFIQFINAQLQIKNDSKQLLMALDKIGQHFYRTDGSEIGYTGLVNDNKIAFVLSGIQSGSGMVWGIKYNDDFIPVFSYEGYNTETGTEAGGIFYFEAPVYLQENTLYLGQDEDSPYIQALDSGRKTFTIGNVDDLYIRDISGNNLITLNNGYLKLVDFLEVGINLYGDYSFDFKNNRIINVANMATSNEVDNFSATTGDYLYVGLRKGGGFTLYPSSSDERLKKDIENSTETAIDKIMKIKHRKFKWKKDNSQIDIGYIAQELEELDKNFIHKNTHKTKEGQIEYEYQINLLSVLATATKAIQEQQEEIEELRQRINQLERKNSNGKDSI